MRVWKAVVDRLVLALAGWNEQRMWLYGFNAESTLVCTKKVGVYEGPLLTHSCILGTRVKINVACRCTMLGLLALASYKFLPWHSV